VTTTREALHQCMGATKRAEPLRILFLDDVRTPNAIGLEHRDGVTHITVVRSFDAAVEAVRDNPHFDLWYLDHDLGLQFVENPDHDPSLIETAVELPYAKTGYDFLVWAADHAQHRWPWNKVHVHSANIVGRRRMLSFIGDIERRHFGL